MLKCFKVFNKNNKYFLKCRRPSRQVRAVHRPDDPDRRRSRGPDHEGGDLRADPAHRQRQLGPRGRQVHQRQRQAADHVRLHRGQGRPGGNAIRNHHLPFSPPPPPQ